MLVVCGFGGGGLRVVSVVGGIGHEFKLGLG